MTESLQFFSDQGIDINAARLSKLDIPELHKIIYNIATANHFMALSTLKPQYESDPNFDYYPLNITSLQNIIGEFVGIQGYKFIGVDQTNCQDYLNEEVIQKFNLKSSDKRYLLTILKRDYNDTDSQIGVAFRETNLDPKLVELFDKNGCKFFRGNIDDPWVCFEGITNNNDSIEKSGTMHAVRNTVNALYTRKYNSLRNPYHTSIAIDTMHYACLFEQLYCVNNLVQFCNGEKRFKIIEVLNLFAGLLSFYNFDVNFVCNDIKALVNVDANPEVFLNLIFEPITNSRKNTGNAANIHMYSLGEDNISIKIIDDASFNQQINPNIMRLFFDNDHEYLLWLSTLNDREFEVYHSTSTITANEKYAVRSIADLYTKVFIEVQNGLSLKESLRNHLPGKENRDERKLFINIYRDSLEKKSANGNGGFGLPQILKVIRNIGGSLHVPEILKGVNRTSLVLGYTIPTRSLVLTRKDHK